MGFWRKCALGGAAVLLCTAGCGGGEGKPSATRLPMQSSGLDVGGDVQPKATDTIKTRITDTQAKQITAACRDAVEITDTSQDACGRAIKDGFGNGDPCVQGEACLIADNGVSKTKAAGSAESSETKGTALRKRQGLAGKVTITDESCRVGPSDVCMRVGVASKELWQELKTTAARASESPGSETSRPSEEPTSEPGTPSGGVDSETPETPTQSEPSDEGPSDGDDGDTPPGNAPPDDAPGSDGSS
ncbi:hypothetical protein AGRA3207_002080 [Actinomadura graeca]|uniref:Uncharacterized protein n=1 Tax=Actinomadura graeca TaxID=2750812 RepID=A0ABX8QST2_9ACTN|nr:hypothetical protein [Actinomadura graeca]QXJ21244.1 hypothetical protein AGRA3207_002080 [Actinomadura graeca]